jgi:hypothetical protein
MRTSNADSSGEIFSVANLLVCMVGAFLRTVVCVNYVCLKTGYFIHQSKSAVCQEDSATAEDQTMEVFI